MRDSSTRARSKSKGALWALALLVTLLGGAAGLAQERAVEAYSPRARPAAELVPIAAAVMGDAGQAVADRGTNQLILIGPRALVSQALALVEAQDRRPPQFLVHYESHSQEELEAAGVRVRWQNPTVGIVDGKLRGRGDRVRATAGARRGNQADNFAGMVRVEQGRKASVITGSSLPLDIWGRGYVGWPIRETVFVEANRGFEVSARLLSDGKVLLNMQPFDARHIGEGEVSYTHASTQARVSPGETVVIASAAEGARHLEKGVPVIYRAGERRGEQVLLVRVEVEGEGEPRPASR